MSHLPLFHIFRLEENRQALIRQQQTDYYSISLLEQPPPAAGSMLLFRQPNALQAGELSNQQTGFSCMFNASLLSGKMQQMLQALPPFRKEASQVYVLNPKQNNMLRALFERMLQEVNTNYTFRNELLGNYVAELIHHALKMQPATSTHLPAK
jgi:AraC family transcriptional activator of pobA